MKYINTDIPWDEIKAVGFDMDGTLYDEFDFILQVYKPISTLFSRSAEDSNSIYKTMLMKWLEKGSSYPFIFSEAADANELGADIKEQKIKEALTIFRNFSPNLNLKPRVKFLLENLKENKDLFLVSDGSSMLQWNKIKALQLEQYFSVENIFVSGDHQKNAEKPGTASLEYIDVLRKGYKPNEIVFIGDRIIDQDFAKNAGFYYVNQTQL